MTRRVLDYNPLTGLTTWFDYTGDDQMVITHTQDVNTVLDGNLDLRNNEDYSRKGIKQDQWHYARIPDAVAMEMFTKHGVNILKPPIDWPSVFKLINTHYPYLKVTDKHHA